MTISGRAEVAQPGSSTRLKIVVSGVQISPSAPSLDSFHVQTGLEWPAEIKNGAQQDVLTENQGVASSNLALGTNLAISPPLEGRRNEYQRHHDDRYQPTTVGSDYLSSWELFAELG